MGTEAKSNSFVHNSKSHRPWPVALYALLQAGVGVGLGIQALRDFLPEPSQGLEWEFLTPRLLPIIGALLLFGWVLFSSVEVWRLKRRGLDSTLAMVAFCAVAALLISGWTTREIIAGQPADFGLLAASVLIALTLGGLMLYLWSRRAVFAPYDGPFLLDGFFLAGQTFVLLSIIVMLALFLMGQAALQGGQF